MQIELSPDDIETIIREADMAARRLRRQLCLPVCDREDLGQDLLVDLLRRLPSFDPARGSLEVFASIVLRNQCSRVAVQHRRQRRAQRGTVLSLEVPLSGSREPIGETLSEADGLATWHGQPCCGAALTELRCALEGVFARLPVEDRRVCAALAHRPVAALAAEGLGSRSSLYRRIARLRLDLAMRGLGGRWDGSEAA